MNLKNNPLPCLFEDNFLQETKVTDNYERDILTEQDKTLLFMTMAVTLSEKNEMPIVSGYNGEIPCDIRGIHRVKGITNPMIAPHFYFDDNRIFQFWNKPFDTEKILSGFRYSISMDFSMTNEMGRPQKIYSSFLNKLWAAWLQSRGHQVIPNISFPDEYWEDYWIEGWPKHSIVAVSSVGVTRHGNSIGWLNGFDRILSELNPIKILRYGPPIAGESRDRCIYYNNDNNRSAHGW